MRALPLEPDLLLIDALTRAGPRRRAAADREGRRAVGLDRRRVDRREGDARRADARPGPSRTPATTWRTTWATAARSTAWRCGASGRRRSTAGPSSAPRRHGSSSEAAGLSVAAKKDSPIKLKQDADAAEKAGRFDKAIELLKQIVQDNPRDWNTVNRIGDLYAKLNKLKEANDQYAEGRALLRRRRLLPEVDRGLEEGPAQRPLARRGPAGARRPLRPPGARGRGQADASAPCSTSTSSATACARPARCCAGWPRSTRPT